MNKETLFNAAIAHAQEVAKEQPFKYDQMVAHPDHPRICKFRGIENGIARLLDRQVGMIEVTVDGLFDPRAAETFVMVHRAKEIIAVVMN